MRSGRRLGLYVPLPMLEEARAAAERQQRSLSWVLQQAWIIARSTIARLPDAPAERPRVER